MAVNALVLAGRTNSDALREYTQTASKALIDINGKPMIRYVVDSLTTVPDVQRVVVVGPVDELAGVVSGDKVTLVPDGEGIVDNVRRGARQLPPHEPILIATSDIPLLTPEVVQHFLAQCQARPADLYYSIVEKSASERKYPLVKRTYVALQDGTFTGGNLFLVYPSVIEQVAPKAEAFIEQRKSPLQLARLLGFQFVLKLILRLLTIADLEERVSTLWGVRGAAIVSPHPEIGIDVDKPADLQLVRAALR